ncbi:CAP domain-containing protein [Clostridium beijerinckii]|uniref:CAP domain-containing protein n=1 Tax=Clostridium beijerinckii TaxID=1520 RepID=A0A7X9SN00_CLOBE|nr:CAP domain-containing protein [Clostridium beijerinckii]NMF04677.1 CAP domain-containing protein [Clostridium beijerinckii]
MRKNGLRRIVTTVIAATTIGSFSSLGVSAATINSNVNDYNNVNINNLLNTNSLMNTSNGNNVGNTDAVSKSGTNATSVNVQGLPNLPTNYSISIQNSAEDKILQLMNEKRTEAGLQPLTIDNTLVQVARYKSDNMIQNNFFNHTNPDGTKWTNWLHTIGYTYTTSGENIAYNTSDPVELFNQWWNSLGHRENMMNEKYTRVGIGVIYGNSKYMGTQELSN